MPPPTSLANLLKSARTDVRLEAGDAEKCKVHGVREDSRLVHPGDLFIAREGTGTSGSAFLMDAIDRGAVAVVVAEGIDVPDGPVVLRTKDPVEALGRLASAFYGDPSDHLALVGITGTNGKTTIATLLKDLFGAAGGRSGLIGTVEVDDGLQRRPAELTTPGAIEIAESLSRMRENKCQWAVMEASSHALEQRRTEGLNFAAGIFTNLSGDHLDYHGSMATYAEAKARLFTGLSDEAIAIVNGADLASARMLESCKARAISVVVGEDRAVVDLPEVLRAVPENIDANGMTLNITSPWGEGTCRVPLVGVHNAFNCAAALATACALGMDFDTALGSLSHAKAPRGRLEPVHEMDDQLRVFVDYAHTDDALDNVLQALRGVVPAGGRLTAVFGAGGDRDRSKRPRMALAACRGADLLMVTSDNPRTEDPQEIVQEILEGVPQADRVRVQAEVDRAKAIERVIQDAKPGDLIVIAGKGHEDYQIIGTTRRHFDDVEIARGALLRRREEAPA